MTRTITTEHLRSWFAHYATSKLAEGIMPKTVAWYRDRCNVYFRWVDDHAHAVGPLDVTALEYYLAECRMKNAPHTVAGNYRAVAIFFNWLIDRGYITEPQAPTKKIAKPRVPTKRVEYVGQEEFEKVYSIIPDKDWPQWRDRLILLILYYSGLRVTETINLTLADIDRRDRLIFVRQGKGNKDRSVPYVPELDEALDKYLRLRPACAGIKALFVSNDGVGGVRGPLGADGVRQMLKRRCRRAGIRYMRPHLFRHGFAMWALNNGCDLSAVSAMLGHGATTITEDLYARWVHNGLRREYGDALTHYRGADGIKP